MTALLKGKMHSGVMMAYGISGAGKTYTIEGPRSDPGVLPQALAKVFEVEHLHHLASAVCCHWGFMQVNHLPGHAVHTEEPDELVLSQALPVLEGSLQVLISYFEVRLTYNAPPRPAIAVVCLSVGTPDPPALVGTVQQQSQVYNDTIYDLLDENAFGLGGRASLRLKEDGDGRVFVAGLSEVKPSAHYLHDGSTQLVLKLIGYEAEPPAITCIRA